MLTDPKSPIRHRNWNTANIIAEIETEVESLWPTVKHLYIRP